VRKKKAKGKDKGRARKAAEKKTLKAAGEAAKKEIPKESLPVVKKPVDLVKVRESIKDLVGSSAKKMVGKVIEGANTGQLASVKYLFEAVGLYPETEQTVAKPQEDSVAHDLFLRLGLATQSVVDVEGERERVGEKEVATDVAGASEACTDVRRR
jgi:hypothetical protein